MKARKIAKVAIALIAAILGLALLQQQGESGESLVVTARATGFALVGAALILLQFVQSRNANPMPVIFGIIFAAIGIAMVVTKLSW